jgi:hypothetical protein
MELDANALGILPALALPMAPLGRRGFLSTLGLGATAAWLRPGLAWASKKTGRLQADQAALYAALDEDERSGKPLVATVLVNLTYYGKFARLDRNMYWAGRGGYAGYFQHHHADKPASKRFGILRWREVPSPEPPPAMATARALFRAPLHRPVYVLVLGYADGPMAMAQAMVAARDADASLPLATPDGSIDAFRDARILGFAGHNPAFDVDLRAPARPAHPRTSTVATFAIGCCTGGTVPSCAPYRVVPLLTTPATVPLLYSDSLMTGEAFSFQAMLTGLMDRLPLPKVVDRANDEYQRVLCRNGERHGRPFTPLPRLYASLE